MSPPGTGKRQRKDQRGKRGGQKSGGKGGYAEGTWGSHMICERVVGTLTVPAYSTLHRPHSMYCTEGSTTVCTVPLVHGLEYQYEPGPTTLPLPFPLLCPSSAQRQKLIKLRCVCVCVCNCNCNCKGTPEGPADRSGPSANVTTFSTLCARSVTRRALSPSQFVPARVCAGNGWDG